MYIVFEDWVSGGREKSNSRFNKVTEEDMIAFGLIK